MGVRVLNDKDDKMAAIYCSTTGVAFGPIVLDDDEHSASERAYAFLKSLPFDARQYTDRELQDKWSEFLTAERKPKAEDNGNGGSNG